MTLFQIAVTAPLLTVAYLVSCVIYNIFLHPLRKYPGPLLGRATDLTMQKNILSGDYVTWIHALHKKYGPVVRYAPNELSYIDASLGKDVYGHRGSAFMKQPEFYGPDIFPSTGLFRADNQSHARQRKLVAHAFSDKALRDQEPLFKAYVNLLIKKLREKAEAKDGETVDLVRWYNYTTFDIMADLTFGEPLYLLEGSDYTPWVRNIFDNMRMWAIGSVTRRWPLFDKLLQKAIPKSTREGKEAHAAHSMVRVDKRLKRETDRPDIWTYVLRHSGTADADSKEKSLTIDEMYSNAGNFMIAGTETTATLLSGMTYYLLTNPEKMERLKKEIRTTFKTMEDINLLKLPELKYFTACIEEALRCYPPVSTTLPRIVPKGGAKVNGEWIPGGTVVGTSQYAANHNEYNFKNPDSYVPERWLPEGEAEYGSDKKEAFRPFSTGPRNCIGKNLASHVIRLIFASLVLDFEIEMADTVFWPDQKVFMLWDKGPLNVKLTPLKA